MMIRALPDIFNPKIPFKKIYSESKWLQINNFNSLPTVFVALLSISGIRS